MKRVAGVLLVLMFCVTQTYALVISEIQFDPSGTDTDREWIEIFNDTSGSADLTSYKFFENNTNHGIEVLSGDKNVESGEYVVLVQDLNKFRTDFPGYTGKIFKSSFSLSNSGETLSLKDKDGNVLNSINYSPSTTGAGNGLTINFDGTNYAKNSANPGTGTLLAGASSNTSTNTATSTSSTTSQTASSTEEVFTAPTYYYRSYFPESEKIYLDAGPNKIGLSGADVSFDVKAVTGDKRSVANANFFWTFGDGEVGEGQKINHSYKFPGEYTVEVEGFANGSKNNTRLYVKVVEPSLKIGLGEYKGEKFVDIQNQNKEEVDIGYFLVKSYGGEYEYTSTLPKKLLILPGKKVSLSQETLKFATSTKKVLLTFPNGKELSLFDSNIALTTGKKTLVKDVVIIPVVATGTVSVFTKENFEKIKAIKLASTTKKVFATRAGLRPKTVPNNSTSTIATPIENTNNNKFEVKANEKSTLSTVFSYFGI